MIRPDGPVSQSKTEIQPMRLLSSSLNSSAAVSKMRMGHTNIVVRANCHTHTKVILRGLSAFFTNLISLIGRERKLH